MLKRFFVGAALLGAMAHGAAALAQSPASSSPQTADAPPPTPNRLRRSKTWLCRPGRTTPAPSITSTTVVAADGKLTRETWTADPSAPIDCFYVYPTVSTDPTPNSDMNPDPAEIERHQAAVRTVRHRSAGRTRRCTAR